MKRTTFFLAAGFFLALSFASCGSKTEEETTATDTTMIVHPPMDTTATISGQPDTVSVPPVDAALDTASGNNAMPPK